MLINSFVSNGIVVTAMVADLPPSLLNADTRLVRPVVSNERACSPFMLDMNDSNCLLIAGKFATAFVADFPPSLEILFITETRFVTSKFTLPTELRPCANEIKSFFIDCSGNSFYTANLIKSHCSINNSLRIKIN